MATITPTVTKIGGDETVVKVAYAAMKKSTDDVGSPINFVQWVDRSVQVTGTFGTGGHVIIKGSNDGGTTWATLTDPQGNNLDFSSAKIEAITEVAEMVRPEVTAGDGSTSLGVTFILRRPQQLRR